MPIPLLVLAFSTFQSPADGVDAYIKEELETRGVPGVSVAVIREGAVVFEKGYGLANIELGVAAGTDTVYELLSVSKQFTATAVMMLVEEQKLTLEDRVAERLDGLPGSWKDVTVSQLLSHTSGIPDYTDQPGWFDTIRTERSPQDLLATVESQPLLFAPGTEWKYSNSNYYVLGLLIEKLGSTSLDQFLSAHIFNPLGMKATRCESFEALIPHRAAGYHRSRGATLNAPWIDPSHKWAAGAFVSSVDDLAKWAIALDAQKVLPPAAHERMLAPALLAGGTPAHYGIANELDIDHGHRVAGHQGGGLGFSATLLRFPDDRLSIIVLANMTQAPSRTWARHLASFWIPDLAAADDAIADPDPAFTLTFKSVLEDAARGRIDDELFASDVRAQMKAFIERVGPGFLGPMGDLEALTPVATKGDAKTRTLRYLARFRKGTITWTVELDSAGKIESMEPED